MTEARPRVIDWAELRRRLDAAAVAVAQIESPSADRVREILNERARALARRGPSPPPGDVMDVVVFRLSSETFALDAAHVIDVFRLRELTLVPGSEPPAFAVTVRHGALLALIDLRLALGRPAIALNDLTTVITLGRERAEFGILADAIDGMAGLRPTDIHPMEAGGHARPWVRGVTKDGVTVLDAGELVRSYQSRSREDE